MNVGQGYFEGHRISRYVPDVVNEVEFEKQARFCFLLLCFVLFFIIILTWWSPLSAGLCYQKIPCQHLMIPYFKMWVTPGMDRSHTVSMTICTEREFIENDIHSIQIDTIFLFFHKMNTFFHIRIKHLSMW